MELFLNKKQIAELATKYPGMSTEAAFNKELGNVLRNRTAVEETLRQCKKSEIKDFLRTAFIVIFMIAIVLYATK